MASVYFMDLIVSDLDEGLVDPVVVVIPIKWMRPILEKYPKAFRILINNLIGDGQFEDYDLVKHNYTMANAGEHASMDDILGWARATKEMILHNALIESSAWDFVKHNTPTDVMMGFDMEIGGSYSESEALVGLIEKLPKNVDNLVLPLHDSGEGVEGLLLFLGSNHLDKEKTLRLTQGVDQHEELNYGRVLEEPVKSWIDNFTLLPKGLYKIKNLSDMNLVGGFQATINYRKLKI